MIRPATANDAEALVNIYNEYIKNTTITFEIEPVSAEEMGQRIAEISVSHPYLVYEQDGKIIGYAYAHPWKARAAYARTWETTIYLDSHYRSQHIGSELLTALIDECKKAGAMVLIACITEGNEHSINLHRKYGFEQVADFKKVGYKFDRWLGVCDFELILK